jgi:hypothetical protein
MKKFGLLLLLCALLSRAGAVPLSFSFYGAPVQLELPASLMQQPALKLAPDKSALEQRIRNWNAGDLEALVSSIQASARLMFLDDVATGRLIHACAQQLYGDGSDAVLFEWLLLRYAAYDAVLGYGGTMKVYVQYAFLTEGTQFVLFMGKKYTLPQGEPDPAAGKETILVSALEPATPRNASFWNLYRLPQLGKSRRLRKCSFSFESKSYKLFIPWMDDVVDYLNDLPVIALGPLFYQTPMNARARLLIQDSLNNWTQGFSQQKKLDFMLAFLQESFPYRRDRDYLNYDRHNFSEQTLAAPYADCEDKAILYAQLVRDVLGLSAILVYNSALEHVAVGIAWKDAGAGTTVQFQNQRYLICEPANYGYRAGDSRLPPVNPGVIIPLTVH